VPAGIINLTSFVQAAISSSTLFFRLIFFLISGVLRLNFLNFSNILRKYVTKGLKTDLILQKCDIFCIFMLLLYTFGPKLTTHRTLQGIPYLN